MSDRPRSLTGELAAQGVAPGPTTEALDGVHTAVVAVLREQLRGGCDLPAGFVERVAAAVRARAKRHVQRAVWDTHMAARDYDTPATAHDAPTAEVRVCPRCGRASTREFAKP